MSSDITRQAMINLNNQLNTLAAKGLSGSLEAIHAKIHLSALAKEHNSRIKLNKAV